MEQHTDQAAHFERPTTHKQEFPRVRRIVYLIVVAGLGITSGAVGFFIAQSQLPQMNYAWYPTGSLPDSIYVTSEPDRKPGILAAQEQTVFFVRERVRRSEILDTIIEPSEYVGSGVFGTSDGLILTTVPSKNLVKTEVVYQGVVYPIESVFTDASTGISFVKIDVRSVRPITIAETMLPGDTIVSFAASEGAAPRFTTSRVEDIYYVPVKTKNDYILSSAYLGVYVRLGSSSDVPVATPLFTFDGKFLGFSTVKNLESLVVPPKVIRVALEQGLRKQQPRDLGIYYVDNSLLLGDEKSQRGVTVYHPTRAAVVPGSYAAKAGLKKGDVVLTIAGESIDVQSSFDYLWKKHQQDDGGIELGVLRNGVVGPISVTW